MKQLELFSTYQSDDATKTATVWLDGDVWGCSFYIEGKKIEDRPLPGHNEIYAENAAENFVLGILDINNQ